MVIKIDIREKRTIVCNQLEKMNVQIEYLTLPVGDYIINDLCIERKDINDYVSSLLSGRLHEQLYNMSYNFPMSFIIVEGNINEVLFRGRIKRQQLLSSLAGTALKRSPNGERGIINIISLSSPYDTALFLYYLHEKVSNNDFYRIPKLIKKQYSTDERKLLVLMSLPNVGLERAKNILSHFKSIRNVFNASIEDLSSVPGIGNKIAKEIYELINSTTQLSLNSTNSIDNNDYSGGEMNG